ncbi:MAG: hypothetical protein ACLFT7_05240 [Thermoplasmata archaeon]
MKWSKDTVKTGNTRYEYVPVKLIWILLISSIFFGTMTALLTLDYFGILPIYFLGGLGTMLQLCLRWSRHDVAVMFTVV